MSLSISISYSQTIDFDRIFDKVITLKLNEDFRSLLSNKNRIQCEIDFAKYKNVKILFSEGFDENIFFLCYSISNIYYPTMCYDSTETGLGVDKFMKVEYLVIGINVQNNYIYRISGFQECDFIELLIDNSIRRFSSLVIKKISKRAFLNQYQINGINMYLLYDKYIRQNKYNNKKQLERLFFLGKSDKIHNIYHY